MAVSPLALTCIKLTPPPLLVIWPNNNIRAPSRSHPLPCANRVLREPPPGSWLFILMSHTRPLTHAHTVRILQGSNSVQIFNQKKKPRPASRTHSFFLATSTDRVRLLIRFSHQVILPGRLIHCYLNYTQEI